MEKPTKMRAFAVIFSTRLYDVFSLWVILRVVWPRGRGGMAGKAAIPPGAAVGEAALRLHMPPQERGDGLGQLVLGDRKSVV